MPNSFKNQKIAADPTKSIWVSASAGTGKTTVLVNRLLRLFLNGIEPSKILCLTYTKAGAINMQNRIYEKTKKWAIISDEELKVELIKLLSEDENNPIDSSTNKFNNLFQKARKLFSKLIDNPIPLKIYTIHAFCQSLLKRFPLEAKISPHFNVIEDKEVSVLREESYKNLISNLQNKSANLSPDVFKSFNFLIENISEYNLEQVKDKLLENEEKFNALILKYKNKEEIFSNISNIIFSDFDNDLKKYLDNEDEYIKYILENIPYGLLDELKDALTQDLKSKNMLKKKEALNKFLSCSSINEKINAFDSYLSLFLTSEKTVLKTSNLLTKSCCENHENLFEKMEEEGERLQSAFQFLNSCKIYKFTIAIINIGFELNKIYKSIKRKKGVMDFNDLILTVKNLLSHPEISGWILYKLDGGISHILIDEAQDTAPIQWEIVDCLTDEFFTSGSNEQKIKTIFSVGDRKQSIFSFQGANIKLFEKYKEKFKNKVEIGKYTFENLPLNRSFRSCKNILNTVDDVIKFVPGVLLEDENISHIAHRKDSDGIVELLPLIKIPNNDNEDFEAPTKHKNIFNSSVIMANILAQKIKYLISNDYISYNINDKSMVKKIEPKDIMILVKERKSADNLTQKLLEYNIPVAGRDKFLLSENIAIQDLISLLKFVLFNYDNLSLAEILKSPLYDLDDEDLFKLCCQDNKTVLKEKSLFLRLSEFDKYKHIYDELNEFILLSKTSFPFEFFDYVLKVKNKRKNFIKRFGIEVEDILNEFLSQCLSYDNTKLGKSLSDFYEWFLLSEIELKRDMEQLNNCVRIMTVHGSKGLEAPVVFLYDSYKPFSNSKDAIYWYQNIPLYITGSKTENSPSIKKIKDDICTASLEEFYRLLYVAMTRAKDRLYVIGCKKETKKDDKNQDTSTNQTWYSCIKKSIENNPNIQKIRDDALINFSDDIFFDKTTLRLGEVEKINNKFIEEKEIFSKTNYIIPEFLFKPVEDNVVLKKLNTQALSPFDEEEEQSLSRGKVIHQLLEYLVKYNIKDIEQFVSIYLMKQEIEDKEIIKEKILELYNNPKYKFLFNYNNLSETELVISEGNITKILRVDNLIINKDNIWIIDYKSDQITPNKIPLNYKEQLMNYKKAISKIYPNKKITCAILWINDLTLQEVI